MNKRIIHPTPLPCGENLVLTPKKNGKHFLEWDSRSGFHQSRVVEGDIWKTTFKTKQGSFEWLVMIFGFCHAPTTFTHMNKDVLKPFLDRIVYLDDIFIFIKFHYEHVMYERKVLHVVSQENSLFKMLKYELCKTYLIYLGHSIGEGEMELDLSKIDAIMDSSMLKKVI